MRSPILLSASCLLLVAGGALAAPQTPPAAILTVQTFGPAAWRARLGPTTFGSVLASAEAEAMWRGYVEAADGQLRQMRGDAAAFARERQRLLDYGGALTVTVWLEHAEDGNEPARWSMTLTADGDGRTDLAALAAESQDWLARLLAVDDKGRRWRDLELQPPQVVDGRLVVVQASPDDAEAARGRALARKPGPLPPPTTLRAELDLPQALGLARDRAQGRDWYRVVLGPATQRLMLTVGAAGPQLAFDFGVTFGAGERGLLGALLPTVPGVPDLDWMLPAGTAAHSQGHCDFAALWATIVAAQAQWEDREVERVQARLRRELGVDLAQDLVPHLGDELLLGWKASEPDSKDHSLFGNLCLLARLRDEAKALPALQTLARALGFATTIEADGALAGSSLGAVFVPSLWLRAGHGVVLLGIGGNSPQQVEDTHAAAYGDRPVAPPRVRPPAAPPGWNGAGAIDVGVLLGRHLASARGLFRAFLGASSHLPRPEVVARELPRWLPLLQRSGLASATWVSGSVPDAWQGRLLW